MSGKGKSKFAGLFETPKAPDTAPDPEPERPAAPDVVTAPGKRGPGRPNGKRSNPEFEQVTAYIRKDTYKAVKLRLLQEEPEREFSELVQELLVDWLSSDI